MKKKYRILLFFPVFAAVYLGLECAGQAMGLLPKQTITANVVKTAVVGLVTSIVFALWARRREKKSAV